MRIFVSAIGQDSHYFEAENSQKPLVLGGVEISGEGGLAGNSDADVIVHALCNAISGLTSRPVLGERADELCRAGEQNSLAYLKLALSDLAETAGDYRLHHLSISVEAAKPKLMPFREVICGRLADLLGLPPGAVCMTATTGEGLSAFGRGEGIEVFCILSASRNETKITRVKPS